MHSPSQIIQVKESRPLRILQVFNQYIEMGGEELWVDRMNQLGQGEVEFYELRFHSRVWKGRNTPGFFRQVFWLNRNPYSCSRLREEIAAIRPDLLIFHNIIPVASFGLYAEAELHGVPVVQYVHNFRPFSPSGTLWVGGELNTAALRGNMLPEIFAGSWENSRFKTAVLSFFLHRFRKSGAMNRVAQWITVSDFMRDKFIQAGLPENKVTTLRHCWDLDSRVQPRPEGDHYIFLGRLVPEKGILTLMDAWEILEQQLGSQCPRLMIGGVGPELERVKNRAKKMNTVEYVGFVTSERKRNLIGTSRALIAPSMWWEPLGLIVYEAYEASRPVITSGSGGLAETVQEGVTGLMHEPGNPASLAECVIKMENLNVAVRSRMGLAGREWLTENASPHVWIQLLKSLAKLKLEVKL